MTAESPTLADQVSKLYELIAGYHATHMIEIGHQLGAWAALTEDPGLTSEARRPPWHRRLLHRCPVSHRVRLRDPRPGRGRLANGPHFDQILGDPESSFYLATAAGVHMEVGKDYPDYPRHFREGTVRPYQEHDEAFMREVAEALKALPRIFLDLVLPQLPVFSSVSSRVAGCSTWAAVGDGPSCRSPSAFGRHLSRDRCRAVSRSDWHIS